ncbi:MAG: peptide-methionine (S)-S-oxide reductase MsrA [Bdellovibrionota bacterium]|nr:peptide-methionine (S)-S-oxide reductase MsrA [Bdellovibrionota bacterium]
MSIEKIFLGAGCFWGVEAILKKQDGVISTEVGYMGGHSENPTYKEVCTGETMHAEVVMVEYDSSQISTYKLLDVFLRLHDPTQVNRQGVDVGTQYRSEIFYSSEEQKEISEKILKEFNQKNSFSKEAATKISKAETFYEGEDYHQDYFDKNPGHLCHTLRAEW